MQTIRYARIMTKSAIHRSLSNTKLRMSWSDTTTLTARCWCLCWTGRCVCQLTSTSNRPWGGGNVFVAHECDNVLIRGVDDAVMLYCFFNSSMSLCNVLSLKASDDAQIKKVRHRPKDELPTLPIPKLLMVELGLTRKELASNLLNIRFMELKQHIILMMLSNLFRRDDLIYMFRYKPGEDFEFSELVFRHYSCGVNAQELAALTDIPIATFNRKFKKAFGMSVMHWLNARRKISILMDLKTTDMTIKKIAAKYNLTPNYLSDFCKKHLGDTPGSFREKD